MPKEQIVFLDNLKMDDEELKQLKKLGNIVRNPDDWPDEKKVLAIVRDSTIIVSKWVYISRRILISSPRLRYVVMAMTGYHDWVDINSARSLQIPVSNVPGFSSIAVAEHAILLMLAVIRKIFPAGADLKQGSFNPKVYQGSELSGKTLGIVGYGSIGKRIAAIALGFGMKVLSVNSKSSVNEFHRLLTQSEFISVHTPLTPQTENLIEEKELSLLPQGAIVINTSRGKVINQDSLIRHLKNGHLGGAGLDVFVQEPPDKNNRLFSLPNVVATPHIAWNTRESQKRLVIGVINNIRSFLRGNPINLVS